MCKVLKLKNNSSQNIVLFITTISFECYTSAIYIYFLRNIKHKIQFWLLQFAFCFYIVSFVENFKHVVLDVLVTTLQSWIDTMMKAALIKGNILLVFDHNLRDLIHYHHNRKQGGRYIRHSARDPVECFILILTQNQSLGLAWAFENSKPTYSDTLSSISNPSTSVPID